MFRPFTGFAYWTSAQAGAAFETPPDIINNLGYIEEFGEAKLQVPYTGYYRVTVTTANTVSTAAVLEIFESLVAKVPNGNDVSGNPITRDQSVIMFLEQGRNYIPLRMTEGVLDVFADPGDDPSPLGVEVSLLKIT